ncbi:DUF2829 domain-containing protein [Agrobacterium vitis]|uniref:DUF2829 domain-containing protein n=1 Tax=Agrobacterium vitis TaxID=373 RepID=UPI0008DC1606|nr:DUF2829 domain-containing protein [Agrobacterium vitis]MUO96621.1 DUF2829 domain-containing protein [Agrobacterium vitis]MUZ80770.1 DUF2829 domain-containing protein [Agrobacterium vitis]MVA93152.1 DUF2829 domain-containing protein [Agrobacterium vitis]MVB04001.1 DUF2829 domain-containing protein [Agrobacterium vitis]NSY12410.1 DUF2829 domain-containing protein [Agrobacterium vitis]
MEDALEFYGTKRIKAVPMTRQEYNDYRGWALPSDENGDDNGYLVEYLDGGKSNHSAHAGYISWSPKEQFEAAYQPTSAMSFGHAVAAMKEGKRVARAGWNGKGMYVAIQTGTVIPANLARGGAAMFRAAEMDAESISILPHIDMRAADGAIVVGWLASQTDMLADDWQIVA